MRTETPRNYPAFSAPINQSLIRQRSSPIADSGQNGQSRVKALFITPDRLFKGLKQCPRADWGPNLAFLQRSEGSVLRPHS
jgi:hypothetical protein